MPSVTDYQVERLTPLYGNLPVGELLQRWWDTFGNPVEDPLTNQKLFDRYTLAGAAGASLQDKAYSYWSAGLLGSAISLPGTAGNYISSPDSVLNSITGDIDIRVKVAMDDWTPAVTSYLIGKADYAANVGYAFRVGTDGALILTWSPTGTGDTSKTSTVNLGGLANNTVKWLRTTLDVDNGAGGNDVKFYTSDDGITWTQLGTTITTAGVTSIFDSTRIVELGTRNNLNWLTGTIYYAEIRNGINGLIVTKYDSSSVVVSGARLPATIPGWTLNGSALYKRDDYIRLPGTSGNYLSYPDTVANSVTGDIDIRAKVSADDWTPAGDTNFISKWGAGGLSFYFGNNGPPGSLRFRWTVDGATPILKDSTAAVSFADGAVGWVRVTLDVDNGAGGNDVKFYTSADGITWTQLGTTMTTAGVTSIYDSTTFLVLGSEAGTTRMFAGNLYYAEVRSGIDGTVVASFDARNIPTPWTINGTGWSWAGTSPTVIPNMALQLPGTSGNYASTPDSAGNSIVGDLDLRAKASLDDWTPAASQALMSKYTTAGNQRTFRFGINTSGQPFLTLSVDGIATLSRTCNTATGFTDGTSGWIRVTLDVDNGSSQHEVKWFTSVDGITWTQLGATSTTAGVIAVFDGTALLEVGSSQSGTNDLLAGKVYYAEVRNGIDGPIVARFDPSAISKTATRLPTTITSQGSPNLLTPNQASIETDATGWNGDANTTATRSTTQFLDGVASLSLVAVAAGNLVAGQNPATSSPAVPGKSYTVRAWFKSAATARSCKIELVFRNAAAGIISSYFSPLVTDGTGGWIEAVMTAVAPPLTVYVSCKPNVESVALGEEHFVDRISLVETPVVWTMNGAAWDWVAA